MTCTSVSSPVGRPATQSVACPALLIVLGLAFPHALDPGSFLRPPFLMRIAKLGVVGAGTMGSGIAALAASARIPVVLLDIAGKEGDRNGPAKSGLERAKKARPAAFMDPAKVALITI